MLSPLSWWNDLFVNVPLALVFAWLVSLASITGVRMEDAIEKYARGCPYCRGTPCTCSSPTRKGEKDDGRE